MAEFTIDAILLIVIENQINNWLINVITGTDADLRVNVVADNTVGYV